MTPIKSVTSITIIAVLALSARTAAASPPHEPDVAGAVRAAEKGKKLVVVELLDSASPTSAQLARDVLASPELVAWTAEKGVVLVVDFGSPAARDPATRKRFEAVQRTLGVTHLPMVVLIDAEGRDRGRVGLVRSPAEWIAQAEAFVAQPAGERYKAFEPPPSHAGSIALLILGIGGVLAGILLAVRWMVRGSAAELGLDADASAFDAPTRPPAYHAIDAKTEPPGYAFDAKTAPPAYAGKTEPSSGAIRPDGAAAPPSPARIPSIAVTPSGAIVRPLVDDPTFGDPDARSLRERLVRGEWKPVQEKLAAVESRDVREHLVEALADWPKMKALAGNAELFSTWSSEAKTSSLPHLLQGRWLIQQAHEARGEDGTTRPAGAALELMKERLAAADKELALAAELDKEDPLPWAYRIWTAGGPGGEASKARQLFAEATSRHKEDRAAHTALLHVLSARGLGSHEQMFGFARAVSELSEPGSWLPSLVALAHIERWLGISMAAPDAPEPYRGRAAEYWSEPAVREEILREHGRSVGNAKFAEQSPRSAVERNWFAFCLWRLGEKNRLRPELTKIGQRAMVLPWRWAGLVSFQKARELAGMPPLLHDVPVAAKS